MQISELDLILNNREEKPFLIAIDGPDGSGKTTFAKKLVHVLRNENYHVIESSMDYFHNPREKRYNNKPDHISFVEDSFDLQALKEKLLEPFKKGLGSCYIAHFDHRTNKVINCDAKEIQKDSILVFEGIFTHQDELAGYWDFSIFLNTSFEECYRRMAIRDGCPPDPESPQNARYYQGQLHYFNKFRPHSRANLVFQNNVDLLNS